MTSREAISDRSIRGDIARIAFYMEETYSKHQLGLFDKWDKKDLISPEENERRQRVIIAQ